MRDGEQLHDDGFAEPANPVLVVLQQGVDAARDVVVTPQQVIDRCRETFQILRRRVRDRRVDVRLRAGPPVASGVDDRSERADIELGERARRQRASELHPVFERPAILGVRIAALVEEALDLRGQRVVGVFGCLRSRHATEVTKPRIEQGSQPGHQRDELVAQVGTAERRVRWIPAANDEVFMDRAYGAGVELTHGL